MGRCMKQYDKDYLKVAILNQEATFKRQVHELHRVYRVQQLLMREMTNTKLKIQTDTHHITSDLEPPAEEFNGDKDINAMLVAYQESDLELTLATGSSRRPKKKETSSCSDSGSSFSSSSTGSGAMKRKNSDPGQFQVPDIDMRFKHETHSRFKYDEQRTQEGLNQNSWFFQYLSLNLT